MDHPFIDGPPDDPVLARATDAVRDEVGSKLCAWIENGSRRVCKINTGMPCLCREVAEVVLMVAAEAQSR
jgi:hypothetical protein